MFSGFSHRSRACCAFCQTPMTVIANGDGLDVTPARALYACPACGYCAEGLASAIDSRARSGRQPHVASFARSLEQ